jgi:hypothetical protein
MKEYSSNKIEYNNIKMDGGEYINLNQDEEK